MRPHARILPTDPDHGPLVLREEDAEHVDTLVGLVVRRRCPMAAHSEGRQLTKNELRLFAARSRGKGPC